MLASQVVAMENFLSTQVQEGTSCMKLTNLSLAILVAVGVAACGGSDDNNSNKPVDPKPTPDNNNNNNNQANDQQVVDPTNTQVVDNKDLTKVSTVGTLQYIRREGSQYDRANNPSKQASASPLLGVTLNDQNPSLTNIVLARQELTRADGQPVKAQFAGSSNPKPLEEATGAPITDENGGVSLQQENFGNVDIFAGMYAANNTDVAHNADTKIESGKSNRTPVAAAGVFNAVTNSNAAAKITSGSNTLERGDLTVVSTAFTPTDPATVTDEDGAVLTSPRKHGATQGTVAATDGLTAIVEPAYFQPRNAAGNDVKSLKVSKDRKGNDFYFYRGGSESTVGGTTTYTKTTRLSDAVTANFGTRYGSNLVWWSAPETAFENDYTRKGTKAAQAAAGQPAAFDDSAAATNGLIRVGGGLPTLGEELKYDSATGKWEDHHNTTTRIFGRYHLAYVKDAKDVNPVTLNTYTGARTFVAEYETNSAGTEQGKATRYSIGAAPGTLKYVQYGRVSADLDLDAGKTGYADNFMRSEYTFKNRDNGVDNYFYRGTDATSIEQMAALPSNQSAVYHGHALMYGIDNNYHGKTEGKNRDLPNAFAPASSGEQALGLGNFVEARVNFNDKRVRGEVYNTWLLDPTKSVTTKDKLVQFQGAITGNTVVGSADRVYITGDDDATFKASFFGDKAQEMGGSFNSVKDTDRYGDAYGTNDWGGVFGATRGETNTFQGDDGNNVYSD